MYDNFIMSSCLIDVYVLEVHDVRKVYDELVFDRCTSIDTTHAAAASSLNLLYRVE